MKLGMAGGLSAQDGAPCREPVGEEDGFEETCIALRGDLIQPGILGGPLDVDHLSRLPGEPLKQPGEPCRSTDPAELADGRALRGEC